MQTFETYQQLQDAITDGKFLFKPEFGPASFKCGVCGATKPLSTDGKSVGTGYGLDGTRGHERFVCYECCARLDVAALLKHGKGMMYYDEKQGVVTNWPGTLRLQARRETGTRTLARFSFVLPGDDMRWLGSMRLADDAGTIARVWRSKR